MQKNVVHESNTTSSYRFVAASEAACQVQVNIAIRGVKWWFFAQYPEQHGQEKFSTAGLISLHVWIDWSSHIRSGSEALSCWFARKSGAGQYHFCVRILPDAPASGHKVWHRSDTELFFFLNGTVHIDPIQFRFLDETFAQACFQACLQHFLCFAFG